MNALVWYGKRDLRFEERSESSADGEVAMEVLIAGICGSDLHPFRGHSGPRVPPLVLGHEMVGRYDGRLHTLFPLVGCGSCARCSAGEENLCPSWQLIGMHRPGVLAEWVSAPVECLIELPAGIDIRRAALSEPLACAVGAVGPYQLNASSTVFILGCGTIGLLAIALANAAGADVVAFDPLPARRRIAHDLGARSVAGPLSDLDGIADLVVDAAGFEATWETSLSLVKPGGDVVALGLGQAQGTFPMAVLVRRGVRLRGQFAYSRRDFARAVELLAADDQLDLRDSEWIVQAPLSEGAQAFARLVDEPDRYVKTLLVP